MQRFKAGCLTCRMVSDPDGEYVQYDEVEKAESAARLQVITALQTALSGVIGSGHIRGGDLIDALHKVKGMMEK